MLLGGCAWFNRAVLPCLAVYQGVLKFRHTQDLKPKLYA